MSRWTNKYVIGLTGNIGVGKSVVRQMTQHLGAHPIDADALSHQAMAPGAPAYKPVVQTFGQIILDADQRINRAMLGSIVFANPMLLKKLEEITHPIIRQAIVALTNRAKPRIVVIEAIKLLEGDLAQMVDEIWVVDAKPETQYRRLIEKRKMSPDEAKQRILAQGAQADKLARATVVIQNDGNIEDTWKQVQTAWNAVLKKLEPAAPPSAPAPTAPPAAPAQPPAAPVTAAPTAAPAPSNNTAPAAATAPIPTPTAAPAQSPAPAAVSPLVIPDDDEIAPITADTTGINVKRGMPNNAEAIAGFISKHSGQSVSRMDVMMAFGQKSYLVAHDERDQMIGLLGWQVENLITRVDEFYFENTAPKGKTIPALLQAVESASKELQSEVGFVLLPMNTAEDTLQPFTTSGYTPTTVRDIKIPAWREALQEMTTDGNLILHKKLRKGRVLQPI